MSSDRQSQTDRLQDQAAHIEMFLGPNAGAGGPFALLGLHHSGLNQRVILRACQSRLSLINRHPRSNTPDADEIRLAVHTAASQLLDPVLRDELVKHWPEGVRELDESGAGVDAWRTDTQDLDAELQSQALRMIAASGGWNRKSRKRLGQFARMHQIPAALLVKTIMGDMGQQHEEVTGHQDGGGQSFEMMGGSRGQAVLSHLNDDALPWAVIPVVYAIMALSLISAGMYDSVSRRSFEDSLVGSESIVLEGSGSSSRSTAVEGSRLGADGSGGIDQGARLAQRRHYSALLFELDRFAKTGLADTEAAAQFSQIADMLCERWVEVPPQELNVAYLNISSVFNQILNDQEMAVASSFLTRNDPTELDSLLHSVFRSSLFKSLEGAMLVSTKNRSLAAVDEIDVLERLISERFEFAASLSSDELGWWNDWKLLCDALDARSEGAGARMWQRAARNQMNTSVSDQASGDWARCARVIVQSLDWKPGSSSRSWMIECVKDPKVNTKRLAELSSALVLYSSAGGVSLETVLEQDASQDERVAYLQKLRDHWATETVAGDDTFSRLIDQLGQTLRISDGLTGTRGSQAHSNVLNPLLELARVNAACGLRRQQNTAELALMMQDFGAPFEMKSQQVAPIDLSSNLADVQWASFVRNLSDRDELLNQIDQLDRQSRVGPKSAHALVYLAMQAPDLEVRTQAERSVLVRPDDPAIIFALERVCGEERTSRRMINLVYEFLRLPDENRNAQAGRTLLMAELVRVGALESEQGAELNSIELELARIWARGSGSSLNAGASRSGAERSYRDAVSQMIHAGKVVPEEIRARLRVGLRNARGPIQRSVVYRLATFELISYQLSSESPALVQGIERLSKQLRLDLALKTQAVDQLLSIERAIAEVWLSSLQAEGIS